MPFPMVYAVKKMVVRLPCQLNRSLESFPAANILDYGYIRVGVKGMMGDGEGDISRQGKAFCCDFVGCELYVKRAVIELLVLLFFCGFRFFFVVNFIAYFQCHAVFKDHSFRFIFQNSHTCMSHSLFTSGARSAERSSSQYNGQI